MPWPTNTTPAETLPPVCYTSEVFFQREIERIFMKAWKMVYPFIDNKTRDKVILRSSLNPRIN